MRAGNAGQHVGTRGFHQFDEFFRPLCRIAPAARMRQDQYGTFAFLLPIEQSESTFVVGRHVRLNVGFVTVVAFVAVADAHIAARHHGGDSML